MKRISLLALLLFLLHACDILNFEDPLAIDGVWIWTEALDEDGDDLLKDNDYQTCAFFKDGTYEYTIDSTILFGIYEVDEGNTLLRLDHSNVWDIVNFSDSSFVLLNLNGSGHKWELKKIGLTSH